MAPSAFLHTNCFPAMYTKVNSATCSYFSYSVECKNISVAAAIIQCSVPFCVFVSNLNNTKDFVLYLTTARDIAESAP